MEITRTRALKIRMGDYESFDISATITKTFSDEASMPEAVGEVLDALDMAMADDVADAKALCGDRKSFVHRITTEKD